MTADAQDQNAKKTAQSLKVDFTRGLSNGEVRQRQRTYGFNEVPEKKDPVLLRFGRKFWGLTAWMLEITMIISFFIHRYFDFYIIAALLIINAIIGFSQEQRATKAVEALRHKLQIYARVLRDSMWSVISSRELVPGDIIRIRSGDFIPADTTVIEGTIVIDQSALTGESFTVEKKNDQKLFSGSIVTRGEAIAVITSTGTKTFFGKTTELLQQARPRLHMEEVTTRVVTWLLVVVLILIAALFGISCFRGADLISLLPLALLLIVFAVPVALPAMFTISMAVGSLELVRQGVLVTRLSALEDAATMDTLCADKTGTITANKLSVKQIIPMKQYDEQQVILYGALASQEANQDPIDLAFLSSAQSLQIPLENYTRENFVPFDPATRRTEVTAAAGTLHLRASKGAVNKITELCGVAGAEKENVLSVVNMLAAKGYRTLAVAVSLQGNPFELCGLVALYDAPRKDSGAFIRELSDLGISVKMLTGDALEIAKETAALVNLKGSILRIPDLKNDLARDKNSALSLIEKSSGFAEIYPEDKYTIVKSLQEQRHVVGMTGDGVNDAPALRQAEVGIAVSSSTDVAKGAASAVLTGEGLSNIVSLVKTGRIIYQRIFTWTLNKIIRTFEVAVFITLAYLLTGYYVLSAADIVVLLFLVDFVTISLSTDKVRWSKSPDKWNVTGIVKVAAVLGALTVLELFGLLYIGLKFFGLASNTAVMTTFFLAAVFYLGMFTVIIIRERHRFWSSLPGRPLMIALILDMIAMGAICLIGLPGIAAIRFSSLAVIFGYTLAVSLLINDSVKVVLIRRSGVR